VKAVIAVVMWDTLLETAPKVIIKTVVVIVTEIVLLLVVVPLLNLVARQEVVVEVLIVPTVKEMLNVQSETVHVVVIDQETIDEDVVKVEAGVEVGAEVEVEVEVELLITTNVEAAVAVVVEITDAVVQEVAVRVIVVARAALLDTTTIDVKSDKLIFAFGCITWCLSAV